MSHELDHKHRDNLEMALVMWTAVEPDFVSRHLGEWRCGTQACFGGHLAGWKHFIEQGVRQADEWISAPNGFVYFPGEPYMCEPTPTRNGQMVAGFLFGSGELFHARGNSYMDRTIYDEVGEDISDHELVLRRLELALFGDLEQR